MSESAIEKLLAEQVVYYRARAPEYLEDTLDLPGGRALETALDTFAPSGHVLELACGPGVWTPQLLRHAERVTAIDAAPEMLAIARDRVRGVRVRFVLADVFEWRPDRRYDVVFFGFGSPTYRSSGSSRSGRVSTSAWHPTAASSLSTTPTARPTSSSRGRRHRPFAGAFGMAARTEPSRCLTRRTNSKRA